MSEELRFDGRVALVTAGGSGIGREHARLLARRGAKVVVNSRARTGEPAQCEIVAEEIRDGGGEAVAAPGTVGEDADARSMVAKAIDTWGRLDIIVNNAGTSGTNVVINELPNPSVEAELKIHLLGPMQINRAAWPHMVKQKYGRIVTTGSATALGWFVPDVGPRGDYPSAKSSLFAAVRQTASAGEAHNIKCNMLMPWAFTDLVRKSQAGSKLGQWMEKHLRPDKIAAGGLFLMHEDCPANGEYISVAGGRVARIIFATSDGFYSPDLTPEDVRDNWSKVWGDVGPDLKLNNMVELRGQPGEFVILKRIFGED